MPRYARVLEQQQATGYFRITILERKKRYWLPMGNLTFAFN